MISIIDGNILDAKEEYILQQCCCTAIRPHGLSETIAIVWKDANIYALRKIIIQVYRLLFINSKT